MYRSELNRMSIMNYIHYKNAIVYAFSFVGRSLSNLATIHNYNERIFSLPKTLYSQAKTSYTPSFI